MGVVYLGREEDSWIILFFVSVLRIFIALIPSREQRFSLRFIDYQKLILFSTDRPIGLSIATINFFDRVTSDSVETATRNREAIVTVMRTSGENFISTPIDLVPFQIAERAARTGASRRVASVRFSLCCYPKQCQRPMEGYKKKKSFVYASVNILDIVTDGRIHCFDIFHRIF